MRILLKISGEALAWNNINARWVNISHIHKIVNQIKKIKEKNYEIVIVMWWWNFFRWIENDEWLIHRTTADNVWMLAIIMNWLILRDMLDWLWLATDLYSSKWIEWVTKTFISENARKSLNSWKIVLISWWTWNPFFTSDTAWVLRALETECDYFVKFTNVDWIYSEDPKNNPNAKLYNEITFDECINKRLKVMDITAFTLAKDNNLKILVTNMDRLECLWNKDFADIKWTRLI